MKIFQRKRDLYPLWLPDCSSDGPQTTGISLSFRVGEGKDQVAARGRPGLPGKDFIVLTGCATPFARGTRAEAKSVMGMNHTWSRIVFLAMHTPGSLFKVKPHLRTPQWTREVSLALRVPLPSVATVNNTLFPLLFTVTVRFIGLPRTGGPACL